MWLRRGTLAWRRRSDLGAPAKGGDGRRRGGGRGRGGWRMRKGGFEVEIRNWKQGGWPEKRTALWWKGRDEGIRGLEG